MDLDNVKWFDRKVKWNNKDWDSPKFFDSKESLLEHTTKTHNVQKNTILVFDEKSEQYVGITDEKHKEQLTIVRYRPSESRFDRRL